MSKGSPVITLRIKPEQLAEIEAVAARLPIGRGRKTMSTRAFISHCIRETLDRFRGEPPSYAHMLRVWRHDMLRRGIKP